MCCVRGVGAREKKQNSPTHPGNMEMKPYWVNGVNSVVGREREWVGERKNEIKE